jgi:hypothetical protein
MSNKVQAKPLLSRSANVSEYHLITSSSLTFIHYDEQLEGNVCTVMLKYPHLNKEKIRNLLEELDNNC